GDIIGPLVEAGAEQNIFTAAARGDVETLRNLLRKNPALAGKTTDYALLGERQMTALHYACRSELGKVNKADAQRLVRCVALLLDAKAPQAINSESAASPLALCALRGGNVEVARLLMAHGWRPNVGTLLAALGHFQRHGRGNYEVADLFLESGVDINERLGSRTLLHAFVHQG